MINLKSLLNIILATLLIFSLITTVHAQDLGDLLTRLMSNPISMATFIIQFSLGLALGYYSMKVIKHILALLGIIVIGVLLNVWQMGGIKEFVTQVGLEWSKVYPLIQTVLTAFGILTMLPIGLGFFIGITIAMRK